MNFFGAFINIFHCANCSKQYHRVRQKQFPNATSIDPEADTEKTMDNNLLDEFVDGVKAIAAELPFTERQTQYLCDIGELPTFKVGTKVCSYRSLLREYLEKKRTEALAKMGACTSEQAAASLNSTDHGQKRFPVAAAE